MRSPLLSTAKRLWRARQRDDRGNSGVEAATTGNQTRTNSVGRNRARDEIVSVAQYVILLPYKPNSGSVNGDKGGKHMPLTRLSSGRRVNAVLPDRLRFGGGTHGLSSN